MKRYQRFMFYGTILIIWTFIISSFTMYEPAGEINTLPIDNTSNYTITKKTRDGMTFYIVSRSNVPNFQIYVVR